MGTGRVGLVISHIDSQPEEITMKTLLVTAIGCSLILLFPALAYAGTAQWNLNPTSGDWNTADNWTPMTIPSGPADVATFDLSNTTNVSISVNTEVSGITFTLAATNPYSITASPELTFTISGVGIANNSGIAQEFVTAVDGSGNVGRIVFTDTATAGTAVFTNNGSTFSSSGGSTEFYDSSTASNASFTNRNGTGSGTSATTFFDTSTAASGAFTNEGGATGGTPFAEGGQTIFLDTSTAANGTFIDNGATVSGGFGGATVFDDSSSAGNGSFTNNGGTPSGVFALGGGNTIFLKTSTAANATFINNSATTSDGEAGVTEFGIFPSGEVDSPTAANGTFIDNGATVSGAVGGQTAFYETSSADSATLIANSGTGGGEGGQILFNETSTGDTSRIEVFGNGRLDVSGHNAPGVTIGSIEGDGDAFLGGNSLIVGSNNLSTTFSGVIQNGGLGRSLIKTGAIMLNLTGSNMRARHPIVNQDVLKVYGSTSADRLVIHEGGFGGSLTKIGTGTLELAGINTYTGDTNVNGGVLQIDGSIASNTFVNDGGALAGSGTVNGAVTNNDGGTISPGDALGEPGVLTIGSNYTQVPTASLVIQIAGTDPDQVSVLNVLGNANLNGSLDPVLVNGFVPAVGQSFAFLGYASVTGVFSHVMNSVFDHGRIRWLVVYNPAGAVLSVVAKVTPRPRPTPAPRP